MKQLMIDIETYSDIDIAAAGSYRYAQSPNFEVLLMAYKFDDEPTQIVDLKKGEPIPQRVLKALNDPTYIKKAYNAAFEWYSLNCAGIKTELEQWECTMVHALYNGYPSGLAATGNAIGLPEDKKKMSVGKALIRYFCMPCKATKSNGGRTRNLPHHEPDKWELFKTYCIQDVEAEYAIDLRLADFPMPDDEWNRWHRDTRMQALGVKLDRQLIDGAIAISNKSTEDLLNEAKMITGLDNPKSNAQMLAWVQQQGVNTDNLRKETVADLLADDNLPEHVRMALELRAQYQKTSVTKFEKMTDCLGVFDRARGLLQFYGANRTGRYCLTGDHEVLTPNGWVRLDEWHGGKIACWTPRSELVSFQNADALSFPHEGPMYHYKDKRIDQISTPDHKMYVKKRYYGQWETDTVENMANYRPSIPFTGFRLSCKNPFGKDELRVLIMVQADGHYTDEGALKLSFKKARKIERCKKLLRRVDIPFTCAEYDDRSTTITINRKAVPLWLRQFKEKVFDWWMLDEDPAVIFDEIEYWDGYRAASNSIQYSSTVEKNVDVLQAIAHMNGMAALKSVKRKRHEVSGKWSDAYVCDIWLTPKNCHEIKSKPTICDFSGTVYCAATKTGYFLVRRGRSVWVTGNSGRLIQVQNLPRNYMDTLDEAREMVRNGDYIGVKNTYGNVPDTLSQLIRTAFIPSDGNKFIVSDFSAIEARVIAWLAGEEWVLDVFRNSGDIYCATASQMFGIPVEKHGVNGELRQKGKIATLALGYQGGIGALKAMGALKMGIDEGELQSIVDMWRNANPHIVQMWWDVEKMVRHTIATATPTTGYRLMFRLEMNRYGTSYLTITLPSGRKLFYNTPSIDYSMDSRGSIVYFGQNQMTKKWELQETYGGKLTENCVQAIARDCLVVTMNRVEDAGYLPVMHIHDEIVIDATQDQNLDDINAIFAQPIPWAPGLPLKGDGFEGNYYMKD